jgi:hypothetical protein
VELTEAGLLLSAMVSECVSTPSDVARNIIQHNVVEVDIVIGPCPVTQV